MEAPEAERNGPPRRWYCVPHYAVIAVESEDPILPLKPEVDNPQLVISLSPKFDEVNPFTK
jgi:hypothetical protein